MKKYKFKVDLYDTGTFLTDVAFKHKWQALLFHILLNKSLNNNGVRRY